MGKIVIIVGNEDDLKYIEEAENILKEFGIYYIKRIFSGFETLEPVFDFIDMAEKENFDIIIVCSGVSTHLAGIIASRTTIPVICVPLPTNNIATTDLIYSSVQMPEGVPVACMSLGKAGVKNSAILAIEILSLKDSNLKEKLKEFKKQYI
ncbi:MAG: AIR carboxylase family protein [Candidatus Omnitrophica bacterium]|nr:AIR carboxylase family protein [Candidatus Omnitrophota bacterium]MCM8806951.1 AIR carboxylase family protein [Candidatus Omnitrophota bacterium]